MASTTANEGLQSALRAELADATDFIDAIEEDRSRATEYYHNTHADLAADEGRSPARSSDVSDTVIQILPSLMRIFFGAKRVAEFSATGPEDEAFAAQATDYIADVVLSHDNNAFMVFWCAFKDALIRKTGVFKWWWDEQVHITEQRLEDVDELSRQALELEEDVEIVEVEELTEGLENETDPVTGDLIEAPVNYNLTIRRRRTEGKVCVVAVPPEEVLIARAARSLRESSIVSHRTVKTVGELVAMGVEQVVALEHAGSVDDYASDYAQEEAAHSRNPFHDEGRVGRTDDASRQVLYNESYLRYDADGDGIGELLRVVSLGTDNHIHEYEPVDEIPLADLCPDPEPHTAIGRSVAELVEDIQRQKTQILRDTFDSLAESIFPRYGVVNGRANMDDILNKEIGAPIRMDAPGMVAPFGINFVGKDALAVLDYIDGVKENRTGVSKASMGLNADALQSATKAAVSATISGAQGHIELIARIFAETGVRDLMRGLLRLIVRYQDRARTVRLRGRWIDVDPAYWNADMDVQINVALGASADEEKMQALTNVAAKQEQILQTAGPDNPLVGLSEYRETLAAMTELSGFRDASRFFKEVTEETLQAYAQRQSQQQGQDPNQVIAQAEAAKAQAETHKIQAEAQEAQVKAQLERQRMLMDDDRERDKLEAEYMLKAWELQLKYGTQVDIAALRAMLARDRNADTPRAQGSGVGRAARFNSG